MPHFFLSLFQSGFTRVALALDLRCSRSRWLRRAPANCTGTLGNDDLHVSEKFTLSFVSTKAVYRNSARQIPSAFHTLIEPQHDRKSGDVGSGLERGPDFWCLRPLPFPVLSRQLDELGSLVYSAFRPQIAPLVVFDERFFRAIILIEKPIDRVAWIHSAPDRRK